MLKKLKLFKVNFPGLNHQVLTSHHLRARDTCLLTISGFSATLLNVMTLPQVLNALSESELVAGMHKYLVARQLTRGKLDP